VTVTGEHPFYAPEIDRDTERVHGDFVRVKDLRVDDRVETLIGGQRIRSITRREGAPVKVYNFNVEDAHTYVANGVMVHNVKAAALGADFVVPAGYANDSYMMSVTSGEHVVVTPAGQGGGPLVGSLTINALPGMDVKALARQVSVELGHLARSARNGGIGFNGL
jgi:hypothetical protein